MNCSMNSNPAQILLPHLPDSENCPPPVMNAYTAQHTNTTKYPSADHGAGKPGTFQVSDFGKSVLSQISSLPSELGATLPSPSHAPHILPSAAHFQTAHAILHFSATAPFQTAHAILPATAQLSTADAPSHLPATPSDVHQKFRSHQPALRARTGSLPASTMSQHTSQQQHNSKHEDTGHARMADAPQASTTASLLSPGAAVIAPTSLFAGSKRGDFDASTQRDVAVDKSPACSQQPRWRATVKPTPLMDGNVSALCTPVCLPQPPLLAAAIQGLSEGLQPYVYSIATPASTLQQPGKGQCVVVMDLITPPSSNVVVASPRVPAAGVRDTGTVNGKI